MTTVKDNVRESMWNYPFLYGDDQYSWWRVLDHLYFVIGNGYEWRDGEIVNIFLEEDLPKSLERHNMDIRLWYTGRMLRRSVPSLYRGRAEVPMLFYPLSPGYSKVSTMPDNVTDDYLIWGMRLLDYATSAPPEWYSSVKKGGWPTSSDYKGLLVEFREFFKDKWGAKLHHLCHEAGPWRAQ